MEKTFFRGKAASSIVDFKNTLNWRTVQMPDHISVQDWLTSAIRCLAFVVFTMFTFFVNQLNSNISSLTTELKAIETHIVKSDERISAIEVSRADGRDTYKKLIVDFDEIKSQTLLNTTNIQVIKESLKESLSHNRKFSTQ